VIGMSETIHIMAGGPINLIPKDLFRDDKQKVWIGVDRGVQYLIEHGIIPDFAVGDFDSVSPEEWNAIKEHVDGVSRFKPEKDETDMELALLWAIKQNPSTIRIYGASGGRLDHFMANALMLAHFKQLYPRVHFELSDIQNSISVYVPGTFDIHRNDRKRYVSFIPLSPKVSGITLRGFKYPLTGKTVPFGSSLCISNELKEHTGTFSFENGILMMIRSQD